jgi:hypothetical protein
MDNWETLPAKRNKKLASKKKIGNLGGKESRPITSLQKLLDFVIVEV